MRSLQRRRIPQGVRILVILVAMSFAFALILLRVPRTVEAFGTIERCFGGWAVVSLEGEDWRAGLPDDLRPYGERQFPVASWPAGMRFDEAAGTLVGADGEPLFRTGERLRLKGSVIEVHGDPSPCYYTVGIRIEDIRAA